MANYEGIFMTALEEVKREYIAQGKEADAALWLNMRYAGEDGDDVLVGVPNAFMWRMMMDKGYVASLAKRLSSLAGKAINIKSTFTGENASQGAASLPPNEAAPCPPNSRLPASPISANRSPLSEPIGEAVQSGTVQSGTVESGTKQHPQMRSEFTFDTFVPGENSEYAYNVCLAAAKEPGKKFNPILLYGGVGLGKTHLMQAVGNYIYNARGGDVKIICVSCGSFVDEFYSALNTPSSPRVKAMDKFKAKYRNCDVFLLDDIQFLPGKPKMQDELFYIFNALRDKDKQLVFTCDRPISQLSDIIVDRLQSRLSNGQCVDLRAPNYDVRRAILQKKLDIKGRTVEDGVVDFIAKEVESNVRDLESALNKILGYAEMTNKVVNVDLARYLLRDMKAPPKHLLTIEIIQKVVAAEYNLTVQELRGKKRDKKVAYPRQVACYLCRELTEAAFGDIGHEFGGRDHTTIMHACDVVATDRKLDGDVDERIEHLIEMIKQEQGRRPSAR